MLKHIARVLLAGSLALPLAGPSYADSDGHRGGSIPVTVANPVLTTTDAFPRTPVRLPFRTETPTNFTSVYTVPGGKYLVLQMIHLETACDGNTVGEWVIEVQGQPDFTQIPLMKRVGINHYYATFALNSLVLKEGEILRTFGSCADPATGSASVPNFTVGTIYGYLVSNESPSLAP